MEARFADVGFAQRAYTSVIRRTIDYGVSPAHLYDRACRFGSPHLRSL